MSDLQDLYDSLAASFQSEIPAKLALLEDHIAQGAAEPSAVVRLATSAHELAGSAGTFGLVELGVRARDLLGFVASAVEHERPLCADEVGQCHHLLARMREATLQARQRELA